MSVRWYAGSIVRVRESVCVGVGVGVGNYLGYVSNKCGATSGSAALNSTSNSITYANPSNVNNLCLLQTIGVLMCVDWYLLLS
jgi:hypothetical protein